MQRLWRPLNLNSTFLKNPKPQALNLDRVLENLEASKPQALPLYSRFGTQPLRVPNLVLSTLKSRVGPQFISYIECALTRGPMANKKKGLHSTTIIPYHHSSMYRSFSNSWPQWSYLISTHMNVFHHIIITKDIGSVFQSKCIVPPFDLENIVAHIK